MKWLLILALVIVFSGCIQEEANCESIEDQTEKAICYCESIENQIERGPCYLDLAAEETNTSICDMIEDEFFRDSCYSMDQAIEMCNKKSDQIIRDECYDKLEGYAYMSDNDKKFLSWCPENIPNANIITWWDFGQYIEPFGNVGSVLKYKSEEACISIVGVCKSPYDSHEK